MFCSISIYGLTGRKIQIKTSVPLASFVPRWSTLSMLTGRASALRRTLLGRKNMTHGRLQTAGRSEPWKKKTKRSGTKQGRRRMSLSVSWLLSSVKGIEECRLIENSWKNKMQRKPGKLRR